MLPEADSAANEPGVMTRGTRSFEVPDFLDPVLAREISEFLSGGMPEDWWFASLLPDPVSGGRVDHRNTPGIAPTLAGLRAHARQVFAAGGFAHFFYRTAPHLAGCHCPVCRVIAVMEDPRTIARIGTAIGRELRTSGGFFCSKYVPGCFLSPHTDSHNGVIAAVYNVTRDWRPQYGGLLHVLDDAGGEVAQVFTPTFNTLVLLDLPDTRGTLHFVSEVAPGIDVPRVAVSGWYR